MKAKIANEHKPRSFSVELKSKRNLKTITVSNGSNERALRKQLIKLVYKRIIDSHVFPDTGWLDFTLRSSVREWLKQ